MALIKSPFILLLLQHLALTYVGAGSGHHSLHTDKTVLLELRKTIVSDPKSRLSNWIESVEVCNFTGVYCNRHHHRVAKIDLSTSELTARISPIISNLTRLRALHLQTNNFYGNIPPALCSLRHLSYLVLSYNNLSGGLPGCLALLSHLSVMLLNGNHLSGMLPGSIFSNCTSLANVDLSMNLLTGKIPPTIGKCRNLWTLNLYNNKFTGKLPSSLTNISLLYNLDVESNNLSGELPANIVGKLPIIVFLHLSDNSMISHDQNTNLEPFFAALANCTSLQELELAGMGLGGRLPSTISKFGPNLKYLLLQENRIFGSIPIELAHLSQLTLLNLTSNFLNGMIPGEISRLFRLEQLFLSHNNFTGPIPTFGTLSHLGLLDLSDNQLSGEIPSSLGNLVHIRFIFLNNNLLSGTIPPALGNCTDLSKLDLSHNRLTGSIPPEISGWHDISIFLNLSHNHLEGPLPIELKNLENVQEIDFSSNNLTGSIVDQISSCIALQKINFSHNSLEGNLPDSLGHLQNLESFDVSGNCLSGKIPFSLNKIDTLTFLNLSFNSFEGLIPQGGIFNSVTNMSFLGNCHLCGKVPGMPSCSRTRHLLLFMIILILGSAFFATLFCLIAINRTTSTTSKPSAPRLIQNFPRMTHQELSEATGGFDEQRIISECCYGRVYKGVLQGGIQIAVKVFHLQSGYSAKSFSRECQVLKTIRHRNLLRIITVCCLPDFKALVFPLMANGSLESHLYPESGNSDGLESSDLTLIQRVSICSDIAQGVAYLHHHSHVKIIHCDIKPSNVLLDDNMTAVVSDFGIARMVMTGTGHKAQAVHSEANSTADLLCGSIGYLPPEYGVGSNKSTKGDVYSFGILVLEMMTRKRPTDAMFADGLNLRKWVAGHYNDSAEQIIDPSMLRAPRGQSSIMKKMREVATKELIELGILCTQECPSTRPTMLEAADHLDQLKGYLSGRNNRVRPGDV
ncbi:hypothetical protein Tsubulata_027844 [Turnera subulata]|uniref:non-specific serine/threonine protein kinase n=1 Tax=Turnera subulata TaxID=218843 RepID=A0A9Q0FVH1_9ROSI|nr:hypothetical protein Tsubulata_027844 [Turnera subulata]